MQAAITAIAYHLPPTRLTNLQLQAVARDWDAAKVEARTGIAERRIADAAQCSSDLAAAAAAALFDADACRPEEIDYLILCTQTPDYFLPTTACLLQARLGLPQTCGALDVNLGCSGYVYGLGLAKALVETGQARRLLLLTADTLSRVLAEDDLSTRAIFGDGAAATLISAVEDLPEGGGDWIGPLVYGTDGRGAENLIVREGAFRHGTSSDPAGPQRRLHMNGPEIFSFTLAAVPGVVERLLKRTGLAIDEVDSFVFHQANAFVLEHLRKRLKIPPERFATALRHCGNTVSSTIPLAIHDAVSGGRMGLGRRTMLVGFGVGYSWGAALARLYPSPFFRALSAGAAHAASA